MGRSPVASVGTALASQEVKNNAFAQLRWALRNQWIETCLKEDWHKAVLVPSHFFFLETPTFGHIWTYCIFLEAK